MAFSSMFYLYVQAPPPVLLSDDGIIYAVALFGFWMLTCLFVYGSLLKPCFADGDIIQYGVIFRKHSQFLGQMGPSPSPIGHPYCVKS